jgi:ribosomal protein L37AE/L43A
VLPGGLKPPRVPGVPRDRAPTPEPDLNRPSSSSRHRTVTQGRTPSGCPPECHSARTARTARNVWNVSTGQISTAGTARPVPASAGTSRSSTEPLEVRLTVPQGHDAPAARAGGRDVSGTNGHLSLAQQSGLRSALETAHRVGRPNNFSILRRSRLVGRPVPRSRAATTTVSSRGAGGGLLSI